MPISGADIVITVAGVDVTRFALFSSARFESQLGAIPGTADMFLKDVDQSLDFTTGDEWTLDVDGTRMWGGFVLNADRTFAFPVVDTTVPADVTARQWHLTGVDYNILFDKRVIHSDADPYTHLPFYALNRTMGELLRDDLFVDFLDLSGDGLDLTTYIDDGFVPRFDADGNPDPDGTKSGSWPEQGTYWRKAMEDFAQFGFVYYIDPYKAVHFHEVEDVVAPWNFSDVPNKLPLPNATATYGMREFEAVEDASAMANDAFVWGGSEWSGTSGGTVFARKQNSSSITAHHRWQYAETHFGELKSQGMVTARANVIVSGNTTGAVGGDTARGLAVDQRQVRASWFAHDVPLLSGSKAHLRSGNVVSFSMFVMTENGTDPLVITVPLRTITITFPTLETNTGDAYVRFDGFFGLQLSDPWWLWKFLRDFQSQQQAIQVVATADGSSSSVVYGTLGSFEPTPATDGATKTFSIPFAYIPGTTQVYQGPPGAMVLVIPGTGYIESDPANGEITVLVPPPGADNLWVVCRLAGGI